MEKTIKKNVRKNLGLKEKIKTFNKSVEDLIVFERINNNSDKLLIVFSSVHKFDVNSNITNLNNGYSWFNHFKNQSQFDVLFISDNLFPPYGWYCLSGEVSTIKYINKFITNFIEQNSYKNVHAFGTSKGGTGALLYGILNDNIDVVITGIPIIAVKDYIQYHVDRHQHFEHFYGEFVASSEADKFNHLFDELESDKPVYFIATEGDGHYNHHRNFIDNKKITNMKVFLDIEKGSHGKAVVSNARSISNFVMELINTGNEAEIEGHIRYEHTR